MYRFFSRISKSHLILVRKKISDGSCSALVVMQAPNRLYTKKYFDLDCPDPTKPTPRPKSRKFLYGIAGFTVLTGAAIVYAKNTPEVRQFLEDYAPPLNNLVALAYQEHTTYFQFAAESLESIYNMVSGFIFGKQGRTPMTFPTRADFDLEKEAAKGFGPKDYFSTLVQTEKCEPQKPPRVFVSKEVVDWEKQMYENTKRAIDNFKSATRSSEDYLKALTQAMELPPGEADPLTLSMLRTKRYAQLHAQETATESAAKARESYATLLKMIENNEIEAPPEDLTQAKRYIKKFSEDLDIAEKEFNEAVQQMVICNTFVELTETARQRYKDELEILFPGIDLRKCTLDAKGEIDLLLLYTMKQVIILQNEIAELHTVRDKKLRDAIACGDVDEIAKVRAEELLNKDRVQRELEFQKTLLKVAADHRRKLNEELAKQNEVLTRVMNDTIARKEAEINVRINRLVSEANEKDMVEYKKQLAAMTGKLMALETALKQQLESETDARKAKIIWAAAEALLAATRKCSPQVQVDKEITAIEKAAGGDPLVAAVVKGIPKDARENGIVTEKALMQMFDSLEKTACSLALIGRDGGTLPMFLLSWLQSKLIFPNLAEIPKDELENRPTDFSKLDNFDIMHRARYYMDRNELPTALRYVNLLRGAARVAARCWADAAIKHLEVRQAAETVMAHAALSGMP